MENSEVMLTTNDNPFNPFEQFTSWFMFDVEKGYNTCSLLARICKDSEDFSTIEEDQDRVRAIDDIVDNDFLNIYKKVTRNNENEVTETQNT